MSVTSLASGASRANPTIQFKRTSIGNAVPQQIESQSEKSQKITEYHEIPRQEGYYIMVSGAFEKPVYVTQERGSWFYRTIDGQRGYAVVDNELFVGPVKNFLDLEGYKVDFSSRTKDPVPKAVKAEMDKAEADADAAWGEVDKLEKKLKVLQQQFDNHPARTELSKLKSAHEEALEKLSQNVTNANVAQEELEQSIKEKHLLARKNKELLESIDNLKSQLASKAEKPEVSQQEAIVNDVEADVATNVNSRDDLLNRLQMLLVTVKAKLRDTPDLQTKIKACVEQIANGQGQEAINRLQMMMIVLKGKLRDLPDVQKSLKLLIDELNA